MATVKEAPPPLSMTPEAEALIAEVEAAGFRFLGWLWVTMSSIIPLAAFVDEDGGVTLAVIGSLTNARFGALVVDCVSHLEGGVKVTTSTSPLAIAQPERGIHKFSHPGVDVKQLRALHREHVQDLGFEVEAHLTTLPEVSQSILDYLELESGRGR